MGEVSFRERRDIDTPDVYGSAVHLVDPGNEIEKRAFSGTGRAHQGKKLPFVDVKGYVVEDGHNWVASSYDLLTCRDWTMGWYRPTYFSTNFDAGAVPQPVRGVEYDLLPGLDTVETSIMSPRSRPQSDRPFHTLLSVNDKEHVLLAREYVRPLGLTAVRDFCSSG